MSKQSSLSNLTEKEQLLLEKKKIEALLEMAKKELARREGK